MVRIFWALVGLPLATQSIQMPTRRRSPPARAVADAAAEIAATPVDALVLKSGRMNGAILGAVAVSSAYALLHNDALEYANLYETHRLTAATAADVLRRFPTDWLSWYDEAALARPVLVKALTSAYCYFVGDLLAQGLRMEERDVERLDLARAARSSAAGFVGHGPVAHYWLGYMDSLDIGVLPKILLDQGPMSIVYNTSRRRRLFPRPRRIPARRLYTSLIGAFALRSPRAILGDVNSTWLPGMRVSLRFWPLVHTVTFSALIPSELKLLWVDACEIIWIAILSQVNNDEEPKS